MLVHHLEVHRVMGWQGFLLEIGAARSNAGFGTDIGHQGIQQIAVAEHVARLYPLAESGGVIRQRHAIAAYFLRQGFQQQMDFFLQHAGHQPLTAIDVHLVQRIQRHRQRHAIARRTRFEMIGQSHFDAGHPHHLREQFGGDAGSFMPHQIITVQEQQLGRLKADILMPFFKRDAIADIGRNQLVVKRCDQFIIDQHVEPA